jgi:hypothetical protein
VERLRQQAGVLTPRIDDWRAMVDSVAIDPAYDGTVFTVALADVRGATSWLRRRGRRWGCGSRIYWARKWW